ncbi:MAG: alpha/beta hydrolase [Rikenellaceae bacterium]
MKKLISLITICCVVLSLSAEELTPNVAVPKGDCNYSTEFVEYKQIDTVTLDIFVVTPDGIAKGEKRPAVVFIHGGGWNNGSYASFENHARYLATKGLVTFSVNYRLKNKNKTTPYEALLDAKSAIRFIRANAERFNIDPDKIITSGGSAGGHLAAAVTMCPEINDPNDDLSVSSEAAAVILFNPVVCNGPNTMGSYKGYGYDRVKDYYKEFSPIYNIREGVPPTIFMVGTNDHLVSVEMAKEYKRLIEEAGGRCDLHLFQNQKHGFYHFGSSATNSNKRNFYRSLTQAHDFLMNLGYLDSAPTVDIWLDAQGKEYVY